MSDVVVRFTPAHWGGGDAPAQGEGVYVDAGCLDMTKAMMLTLRSGLEMNRSETLMPASAEAQLAMT
jgi:hypothetical protein